MVNIIEAASERGYMQVPKGILIDIKDVNRYPENKVTLVTTGSQGEPMSALYRLAFGAHDRITLGTKDLVVISATAIPGNEKSVGKIINALIASNVSVMNDPETDVHVSGHACREELKLMHALTKPKYFMPIHGELRHLDAHRKLALEMGMDDGDIFVSDIGRVLEIDRHGARFNGTVPAGKVLIDGIGVGDVGSIVLRDRKLLSQDGLIVVVAAVDTVDGFVDVIRSTGHDPAGSPLYGLQRFPQRLDHGDIPAGGGILGGVLADKLVILVRYHGATHLYDSEIEVNIFPVQCGDLRTAQAAQRQQRCDLDALAFHGFQVLVGTGWDLFEIPDCRFRSHH